MISRIAQTVDKEAYASAVEKRGFLEVENKMVVALSNQPGNFIVEDFGAFGAVDIADDMNYLKVPQILYFVLHTALPRYADGGTPGPIRGFDSHPDSLAKTR